MASIRNSVNVTLINNVMESINGFHNYFARASARAPHTHSHKHTHAHIYRRTILYPAINIFTSYISMTIIHQTFHNHPI